MAEQSIQARIDQGTVQEFRRIETRTGRPMAKARVEVGKERVDVVLFNTLAEDADLQAGDVVTVAGRVQNTSWTAQDGSKRFGWQLVADTIRLLDGDQADTDQHRDQEPPPPAPPRPAPHPPTAARPKPTPRRMFDQGAANEHDYSGGPF